MGPTKILKTEVDEFSSYARDCILDKKSLDRLRQLYGEWQKIREEVLETKRISDSVKRNIKLSPEGQPSLLDENVLRSFELKDRLDALIKEEEKAHQALQNYLEKLPQAPYDRYRLRDNFRNCLERTGIPLGELEVDGGISRGGFSRWEKTIMTSELPLSFLLVAAERFGVTLKELLYGDIANQTAEENGMRQFIGDLTDLTNKAEMDWKKIEPQNQIELFHGNRKVIMYNRDSEEFIASLFDYGDFRKEDFRSGGDSYCADIPGSQDVVAVFTLKKIGSEETFLELYIKPDGQQIEPLYSTFNGDSETSDIFNELIAAISSSLKRTRISQEARQVMNRVARLVNRPGAARIVGRGGNSDEG